MFGRGVTLDARAAALADDQQVARARNILELRLDYYFGLIKAAKYDEAYQQLRADRALSSGQKKAIIGAVNISYLFQHQLEWGNHGIRRSFRFWSEPQKNQYVELALELVALLRAEVTPHVSFGFGSVLGMIRDKDFIPHDDDMDLIIALPAQKRVTFSKVLANLRQILLARNFVVPESRNLSHLTTARPGGIGTDIFVGFIDPDQRVSWFPSARRGFTFNDIFPTQTILFFGGDCPIPRDPLKYLAVTYGSDWRTPISNWDHPWETAAYRQFI